MAKQINEKSISKAKKQNNVFVNEIKDINRQGFLCLMLLN